MPSESRVLIRRAWLILAAVAALSGCSPGEPRLVPVAGRVLIDGEPLRLGYIRFVPERGRASGGQIDTEGRFALTCRTEGDGAVTGRHRIEVIARERLDAESMRIHAPNTYEDITTSGLSAVIEGPTAGLTIELSWNGGGPFVQRDGR